MVSNVHSDTTPTSLCLSYQRGDSEIIDGRSDYFSIPKYKLYPYTCYSLLKEVILIQPILAYLTPVK